MQYLMRWFGASFSFSFLKQLMARPVDSDFPQGSFQIESGTPIDVFISYRGSTGRSLLYLTLCGFYNILPAFIFMFVVAPFVVGMMSLISDPCIYINADAT